MRTLTIYAAAAFMLALVCPAAAGARQQQNPNSLGSGGGSQPDAPATAGKSAGKSAAKSAQKKDKAETGANGQEPARPDTGPERPRRGHHD